MLGSLESAAREKSGRCGLGLGSLVLTAGLLCAGATAQDPYWALLFLSLGAGALLLGTAAYFAATIDLAHAYAGTVGGFMNMGGNLGGALSPTLTPLLAQRWGWESAFYVAAGLAVLGALCWLGVHPERTIDLGEPRLRLPPQPAVIDVQPHA